MLMHDSLFGQFVIVTERHKPHFQQQTFACDSYGAYETLFSTEKINTFVFECIQEWFNCIF